MSFVYNYFMVKDRHRERDPQIGPRWDSEQRWTINKKSREGIALVAIFNQFPPMNNKKRSKSISIEYVDLSFICSINKKKTTEWIFLSQFKAEKKRKTIMLLKLMMTVAGWVISIYIRRLMPWHCHRVLSSSCEPTCLVCPLIHRYEHRNNPVEPKKNTSRIIIWLGQSLGKVSCSTKKTPALLFPSWRQLFISGAKWNHLNQIGR